MNGGGNRTLGKTSANKHRIIVYISLIQDIERLMPIICELERRPAFDIRICVQESVARHCAQRLDDLRYIGMPVQTVAAWSVVAGFNPKLRNIDALVTASESNLRAHFVGHVLTKRANRMGVRTYTVQHGHDQIGLTYLDGTGRHVEYASRRILTWRAPETLPPGVSASIRKKCVPIGFPASPSSHVQGKISLPVTREYDQTVLICENLHWDRFDGAFRARFVSDALAAMRARPDMRFIVRTHPAGQWWCKNGPGTFDLPGNACLLPTEESQRPLRALLDHIDAVITTPSTVALDAAFAGRSTAVTTYDLDAVSYAPLAKIRSASDWLAFLDLDSEFRHGAADRTRSFAAGAAISTDGAAIAADYIAKELNHAQSELAGMR